MSIPTRIARLNSDGSTDDTFDPGTGLNAAGRCVAQLPDGRYLAGGDFTNVGGFTMHRLAVLSASGAALDALSADGPVHVLMKQADGPIIVGGDFGSLDDSARVRIARLRSDLSLDPVFLPAANAIVRAGALQADGLAVLGGDFTFVNAVARSRIMRLHNDPASMSLAVVSASRVVWQRGGSKPETEYVTVEIDTGSGYTAIGGTTARIPGGWEVSGLALSGDGTIRARAFPSDGHGQWTDEAVAAFDFVPELQVSIGPDVINTGSTLEYGDTQVGSPVLKTITLTNLGLASLTLTGGTPVTLGGTNPNQWAIVSQPVSPVAPGQSVSFQLRFSPTSSGSKTASLALASDDAGSPFTLALAGEALPGPGSLDPTFSATVGTPGMVSAVVFSSNLFIGGQFPTVNGVNRNGFARLDSNGTLLAQTGAGVNNAIVSAAVQLPDGRFIIGGTFTTVNGATRQRLARINADGALDTTFTVNANGPVTCLALQHDGRVIVGGGFSTLGGQPRKGLARLTPEGALDPSWSTVTDGIVAVLAIQPDGKVLVGGQFGSIGSLARVNLARLNADGSGDGTFDASYTGPASVYALAVQSDGKILTNHNAGIERLNANGTADGDFEELTTSNVQCLVLQADGKILAGCQYTTPLILRRESNGADDTTFVNSFTGSSVNSLALSASGAIFAGGSNIFQDGQARRLVKVINGLSGATSALSAVSASEVQWQRGGTAQEAQYVVFDLSQDGGTNWVRLGRGERVTGGWRLAGLALPASGSLRGRAYVGDGKSGCFQDAIQAFSGLPVPDMRVTFNGLHIPDDGSLRIPGLVPGQVGSVVLKIENSGNAQLNSLVIASTSPVFTVTSLDLTSLAPGQVATAVVQFAPSAVQEYTGNINITSNVPAARAVYRLATAGRGVAAPTVTTQTATTITTTAARLRGKVKPNHDATSFYFEYKKAVDSVWSKAPVTPRVASGFIAFDIFEDIGSLTPATVYNCRLVAYNSVRPATDPVYGATVNFTTA